VAYAGYRIHSNIVSVKAKEYTISLNVDNQEPIVYEKVNFTGQVKLDDQGVNLKMVILYQSYDNVNWEQVASNITDSNGFFNIAYNITTTDQLYFRCDCDVP